MFNVAFTTFEFKESFSLAKKALSSWQHGLDFLGLLASTYLCFKVDMGLGVLSGVLITRFIDIVQFIAKKSSSGPSPKLA